MSLEAFWAFITQVLAGIFNTYVFHENSWKYENETFYHVIIHKHCLYCFLSSNIGELILKDDSMWYFNFFIADSCSHMSSKDASRVCHDLFLLEDLIQYKENSNQVDHM